MPNVIGPGSMQGMQQLVAKKASYGPSQRWMHIVHVERQLWKQGQGPSRLAKYRNETGLGGRDWCSIFVNWVMQQVGYSGTRSGMASSWVSWGTRLSAPKKGAICVLDDGFMDDPSYPNNPYFHVTFLERHLGWGLDCVGGNQHGMVDYSKFELNKSGRVRKTVPQRAHYVWPSRG